MRDAPECPIPMVRIVDGKGKEIARGWYIRHESLSRRNGESEYEDCVAVDQFVGFGYPRQIKLLRVTAPHRIEPVVEETL